MNNSNKTATECLPPDTQRSILLNEAEAKALFRSKAVYIGQSDAIPYFIVVEMFGKDTADFGVKPSDDSGLTCNIFALGNGKGELKRLYEKGFLKAVSYANAEALLAKEKESKATA